MYRAANLLANLGWVDLDLHWGVPLAGGRYTVAKYCRSRVVEIKVSPTQVHQKTPCAQ